MRTDGHKKNIVLVWENKSFVVNVFGSKACVQWVAVNTWGVHENLKIMHAVMFLI
jgi:hypothetical protein